MKSEGNCAVSYPTLVCGSMIKYCISYSVETVNYMFRDSRRLVHRDFWKLQSEILIQVTAPLRLASHAHICLDFLLCIACWFLLFPCSVSSMLRHFIKQTERSWKQVESYFWSYFPSDTGTLTVFYNQVFTQNMKRGVMWRSITKRSQSGQFTLIFSILMTSLMPHLMLCFKL